MNSTNKNIYSLSLLSLDMYENEEKKDQNIIENFLILYPDISWMKLIQQR